MLPDRREGTPLSGVKKLGVPAKRRPPFGFFKGFALGVIVVIPSVAATVWLLSRLGLGKPGVTMVQAIRMTTLFAGVAASLTAGGIGRLAADSSLLPGGYRGAVWRATRVQAVAGAGLTLIASIPHGHLPESPVRWIWIGVAGLATGAIDGALIGLICGAPATERLPDFLRRVPVLAEWARAAAREAAKSSTSIPAQGTPTPPPPAAPIRPMTDADTPLPAPIPLGDEPSNG